MNRPRLRAVLGAVALCAATFVAPATVTTPAVAATSSTLPACQKLTAHTTNDRLVNGKFAVEVNSDFLQITETEPMWGSRGYDSWSTGTWFRDDPTGRYQSNTDRSYLALHCNGDLALRRSTGYLLWHSNTANRGIVRAQISQWGNLLLLNASGGVVWQSGTIATAMAAGAILPSGGKLVSRWGDHQGTPVQTLTMQPDGNLVHRSGTTVKWQSNTRVAGSVAGLSSTARLFVRSPQGKILWASACAPGTSYSIAWLHPTEVSITDWGNGITSGWSSAYGC